MAIPYPRGVRTVDKYGVSVSGDQGNGPLSQPKVSWKFRVLFLGFGSPESTAEPITLNTNSVTLPTLSHESVEINSYNSKAYYAGRHTWSEMSLTVRDTVDNTVGTSVGAQLQRQLNHYQQTSFLSASDYKFRMMVQQLTGGHDDAISNWTMEGCFLLNVEWGQHDYSSSEPMTITMSVRPDNVIIENFGQGTEYSIMADPGPDPMHTPIAR